VNKLEVVAKAEMVKGSMEEAPEKNETTDRKEITDNKGMTEKQKRLRLIPKLPENPFNWYSVLPNTEMKKKRTHPHL